MKMAQQQLIRMNGIFNAVIITIAILSQVSESATVSPGDPTPAPACTLPCSSNKECVVDDQGQQSCVCSGFCPMYCSQICGSNGVTYCNPCLMNSAACESNTVITEAYAGQCVAKEDPCEGVRCGVGSSCEVVDKNHAKVKCVCDEFCSDLFQPLCGSDDKTYNNICELDRERCQKKRRISIACHGECEKGRKGKKPKCINDDV